MTAAYSAAYSNAVGWSYAADIENEQADTRYEIILTRIEPWKVVIAAVVAAAAIGGLAGYKLGSMT